MVQVLGDGPEPHPPQAAPDTAVMVALALTWAVADTVGRKGRRRLRRRLEAIEAMWRRAAKVTPISAPEVLLGVQAAELAAAADFLGPALAMLTRMFPEG